MANHASAKQRIRRNDRRSEINGARVGRIRSFVKKIETAIASGDKNAARDALKTAQPEMQRGASVGVMHRNTVARRISRLNARIKAMP